jgi:adenine-specific DNA-methyltransferase
VAKKNGKISEMYKVLKISGGANSVLADCLNLETSQMVQLPVEELVSVACFGDPIFPSLEPVAKVENAPKDSPWHTVIEADNFHALQLLAYLYPKQVDCIYIDPPYNTGARDWKYNNDYVDASDAWRHSKWLSMMQKRLNMAKKILKPQNSVLIVTIDEKEYTRLGLLLEEIFPEARMQMVSIVTNPFGQERAQQLARVEEYAFFLFFGNAAPCSLPDDLLNVRKHNLTAENSGMVAQELATPNEKVRWEWLLRGGADAIRRNNPGLFYPVFIDIDSRVIHSVGEPLPLDVDRTTVIAPDGTLAVWPIKTNDTEGRWRCSPSYLRALIVKGHARIGEYDKANDRWTLLYLSKATARRIEGGEIKIIGRNPDGSLILGKAPSRLPNFSVKTVWNRPLHRAGEWGTRYIRTLLPGQEFPYPKSLYAVVDTLRVVTANKPNALIVDFFAGSGTTLHAVNLLNAEDGGSRQCILVTNNEVSEQEARSLRQKGHNPGDAEWEKHGICRSVTWPRTEYSI